MPEFGLYDYWVFVFQYSFAPQRWKWAEKYWNACISLTTTSAKVWKKISFFSLFWSRKKLKKMKYLNKKKIYNFFSSQSEVFSLSVSRKKIFIPLYVKNADVSPCFIVHCHMCIWILDKISLSPQPSAPCILNIEPSWLVAAVSQTWIGSERLSEWVSEPGSLSPPGCSWCPTSAPPSLTEPHKRQLQLSSVTSTPRIDGQVFLMETVTWSDFHGP